MSSSHCPVVTEQKVNTTYKENKHHTKTGKGWIAKDTKRQRWYATKSLAASNKLLAARIERDLKQNVEKKKSDTSQSKLKRMVEQAEHRGDRALNTKLAGVDMKLELMPKRGDKKQKVKGII